MHLVPLSDGDWQGFTGVDVGVGDTGVCVGVGDTGVCVGVGVGDVDVGVGDGSTSIVIVSSTSVRPLCLVFRLTLPLPPGLQPSRVQDFADLPELRGPISK